MSTTTQAAFLAPGQGARAETGVLQFGDDWPGVFIRGDDALALAYALGKALGMLARGVIPTTLDIASLVDLRDVLARCHVGARGTDATAFRHPRAWSTSDGGSRLYDEWRALSDREFVTRVSPAGWGAETQRWICDEALRRLRERVATGASIPPITGEPNDVDP